MSSVHARSSLVRLSISLRGPDFWSCVSSAKSWWFMEWLAMVSDRGVVYRMKRMGPSTEPWGTPYLNCVSGEDELFTGLLQKNYSVMSYGLDVLGKLWSYATWSESYRKVLYHVVWMLHKSYDVTPYDLITTTDFVLCKSGVLLF